jgi:uncharacterized membrane protein YfcA
VFVWHNIHIKGLFFDITMIPFILLGLFLGVLLVKFISEKYYRILVYIMTVASCALLIL